MLVESLMTREVEASRPESTLADAAAVMWRRDCGVVPVTDEEGRVVGVVTDRDICMALSMRGERAGEVRVAEVMARDVEVCTPVDDVREALEAMARRQVRRLPVVDSRGRLVGLLSINDIIRHTRKAKSKKRVSRRATLAALRAVCAPHGAGVEEHSDDADDAAANEEHYDERAHAQETEEAGDEAGAGGESK
jgi:CBS domain-containing protein